MKKKHPAHRHGPKRTGRRWWTYRNRLIEYRGGRCNDCYIQNVKFEVHHLWSLRDGGPVYPDDPDCPTTGLLVLCRRCHIRRGPKRIPEQQEWDKLLNEKFVTKRADRQ